jgi:hypothetical protein
VFSESQPNFHRLISNEKQFPPSLKVGTEERRECIVDFSGNFALGCTISEKMSLEGKGTPSYSKRKFPNISDWNHKMDLQNPMISVKAIIPSKLRFFFTSKLSFSRHSTLPAMSDENFDIFRGIGVAVSPSYIIYMVRENSAEGNLLLS